MAPRSALHTLVPVGRGAMATVYRAHDPERGEWVAVKYLHGCDPTQVRRMRREAQAQRALDHPGICRIHEFGEDARGAYIVMQYIDGRPLDTALAELDVERRLAVFADVCDAVGHAHRHGLVHRDLKPDNILVEQHADGSLRPYVVDFGLVHEDRSTLTALGDVLGTPAYMAPEQARGDAHVDRRADVFSLGAILYQLLTGVSPFQAEHHSATLARVLHVDPVRPRSLQPNLPPELERVLLHALEKEPRHRYDSANALARDVRRHLAGESVHARRGGWSWRLRRGAARHPRTALAAALALAVTAGAVSWSLHARSEARAMAEARALAAQQLGAALGELEWEVRALQLVPPHDIEPRLAAVRARADRLAAGLESLGPRGTALGEYALGRAQLALGEHAAAIAHLRRALALGHDSAETRLHLGLALAQRWIHERAALDRIADAEQRAALHAAADARLRQPALAALAASAGAATPYARALQQALQGTLDPAALQPGAPWEFEPLLLRAEVLAAPMDEAVVRGVGVEVDAIAAAAAAVGDAAVIAPSSPAVAAAGCRMAELQGAAAATGAVLPASDAMLALCLRGTVLQPGSAQSHAEAAHALIRRHTASAARGAADAAALERGVALAEAALALPQGSIEARWTAADALARGAWELRADGARSSALLATALGALEAAATASPGDLYYRMTAGAAARKLAALRLDRGADASDAIARAVAHLEAAARNHPDHAFVWNNLGYARKVAGRVAARGGEDATPFYRDAIAALERAAERAPGQAPVANNLANAWSDLGQWQLRHGGDALAALDTAMRFYDRALAIDPGFVRPHNNRANVARIVAHHLAARGQDPAVWIAQGFTAVQAAIAAKPDYPLPRFNAASMKLAEARFRYWTGAPLQPALDAAREWFDAGLALAPLLPARVERLQLEILAARDVGERGLDTDAALARIQQTLAALRSDAAGRRDLALAGGELALLQGMAQCAMPKLQTALSAGEQLQVHDPMRAAALRLQAEAGLRLCQCDPAQCHAERLSSAAQALAALANDALPMDSLRLRYALARHAGGHAQAEPLLASLAQPLRARMQALAQHGAAVGGAQQAAEAAR